MRVIAIRNPSRVLFGLTFCKNLIFPNFFPPKYAKESIKTLIDIIIKRTNLFVISIPKYLSSKSSCVIRKYKDAKKPKCIITPDINQIRFLCNKGLLTGKLMIKKSNPICKRTLRLIKVRFRPGKEDK